MKQNNIKEEIKRILRSNLDIKQEYGGGNYSIDTDGNLEDVVLDGDYDFTDIIEELTTLIDKVREEAVRGYREYVNSQSGRLTNQALDEDMENYLKLIKDKDENKTRDNK